MDLIDHIEQSFENANLYKSKINDFCKGMDGMSGEKTRHFYNNICSLQDCRYLEIGIYTGSSSCSALCNNNIKGVFIDNFQMSAQHGESKQTEETLISNINKVKGDNEVVILIEDCWSLNVEKLKEYKFNVYLYDGNHDEISQYNSLKKYLPCLDDKFIFIVDDWNDKNARNGTMNAIADMNLQIIFKKEILLTNDNTHTPVHIAKKDFWNGIGVFLLQKHN